MKDVNNIVMGEKCYILVEEGILTCEVAGMAKCFGQTDDPAIGHGDIILFLYVRDGGFSFNKKYIGKTLKRAFGLTFWTKQDAENYKHVEELCKCAVRFYKKGLEKRVSKAIQEGTLASLRDELTEMLDLPSM
jgi:hypothetical protein